MKPLSTSMTQTLTRVLDIARVDRSVRATLMDSFQQNGGVPDDLQEQWFDVLIRVEEGNYHSLLVQVRAAGFMDDEAQRIPPLFRLRDTGERTVSPVSVDEHDDLSLDGFLIREKRGSGDTQLWAQREMVLKRDASFPLHGRLWISTKTAHETLGYLYGEVRQALRQQVRQVLLQEPVERSPVPRGGCVDGHHMFSHSSGSICFHASARSLRA